MKKIRIVLSIFIILFIAYFTVTFLVKDKTFTGSSNFGTQSPLVAANAFSAADKALAILKMRNVKILGDSPKVLLTRKVTATELENMEIVAPVFANGNPQLELALVKGSFDLRGAYPSISLENVKYILYIFDVDSQVEVMMYTSVSGKEFEKLLALTTSSSDSP